MKASFHMRLSVLALLLVTAPVPVAEAREAAKTSIPKIARLGKIQIGYSTQEELTKHWGDGKTITGGHPNSGRLWRVKGTSWILQTDGFEYSERGLVVDSFAIYEDAKQFPGPELLSDVPFTRLTKSDFAWAGEIRPGMAEEKVRRILKHKVLPLAPAKGGYETSASGYSVLISNMDPLRTWTASLVFTNGMLNQLTLNAGF